MICPRWRRPSEAKLLDSALFFFGCPSVPLTFRQFRPWFRPGTMADPARSRTLLLLQSDWDEAIRVKGGEAWVTCKPLGQPGLHGKIQCESIQGNLPLLSSSDGFTARLLSPSALLLSYACSSCAFLSARTIFKGNSWATGPQKCMDVTPGGIGASPTARNSVVMWDSRTGQELRRLEGHFLDVYSVRYFPSGQVLLTGGADMQLRVWCAKSGKCGAVFKGHTASVADTCIVDRGRNVISVSADGTLKLWDCGRANCLATVSGTGALNSCAIFPSGPPPPPKSASVDDEEREVGTAGKLCLVGSEASCLMAVSISDRNIIWRHPTQSAANCVCATSEWGWAAGLQDGSVVTGDIRQSGTIIQQSPSQSTVFSLRYVPNIGLFVGRADGTCTLHSVLDGYTLSVPLCQLTGPDCDPVYSLASDPTHIYTGARDGAVRKYTLAAIAAALEHL